MTTIALAPYAYSLKDYGLPSLRCTNVFVGASPGGPGSDARFPRPGLVRSLQIGSGAVWGMKRQAGTFGGDLFSVVGSTFYRNATAVGDCAPTRRARFAMSDSQVVCAAGGKLYLYDGIATTIPAYAPAMFRQISVPDDLEVWDTAYLGGRFYYLVKDSDRFYWSGLNDAETIDGLAFATAESSPDATVGIEVVGDELWFLGLETTEPWRQTGNIDLPIQRSSGRTRRGCAAQQSIVPFGDNSVIWLANDLTVVSPQGRLSNHSVETRLANATGISDATGWSAKIDGHEFYILNIPGQGTVVYDASTQQWSDWTSLGRTVFRGRCGVFYDSMTFVGDDADGSVHILTKDARTDNGEQIELVVSGVIPAASYQPVSNVSLRCAVGTGYPTGDSDERDPSVEMRWSDDMTRTWTDWEPQSLGVDGDYTVIPMWWNLGSAKFPGRILEFRSTSPVLRAFGSAAFNDLRAVG